MSPIRLALLALLMTVPLALAGGGGHNVTGPDVVQPDSTLSMTFDKIGTFDFYCRPHPGMEVRVIVSEDVDALDGSVKAALADLAFKPAELKVRPGATVVWTNSDEVAHTVTAKGADPAPDLSVAKSDDARSVPGIDVLGVLGLVGVLAMLAITRKR